MQSRYGREECGDEERRDQNGWFFEEQGSFHFPASASVAVISLSMKNVFNQEYEYFKAE